MGVTIFRPAPPVANETSRREAVLRSGLLMRRGDGGLTALARETRALLDTDWAGIVVILDDWQHVVASSGGHIGPHRRSGCISSYVILDPTQLFCVPDVPATPQFHGSAFVDDGLIGFYAGVSIVDADGFPLGVLCVTKRTPRPRLDDDERAILWRQARAVL